MRVCIYARVDGENQAILDMQIEGLKGYAAANGDTVTAVVPVLGPAAGATNKQTLQTVLAMAGNDAFDAVLAVEPSRFSRDAFAYHDFAEALKAQGKLICYTTIADDIDNCLNAIYALRPKDLGYL